ncbi:protein arginine N-methyltransferase 7 [Anopheles ziemanni]|uniref:protein arginine N-methyltransferase 7 n=1 Tax=Anopheles coustani TaxID=139045 RepID=UPI00265871DA|nr:protein arginine N-methyltransferase 7 [Anopheles coustani]XP_058172411.1 protein arginine N-methyltransferase 7 [Anopheles ziemanni]
MEEIAEVGDDGFDLQQEIARSAFADMCHDWERNQKYDQALRITIERLHKSGKQANVLDIGTGSGLLSMMAVRAGADSVIACEAFRPMADCAERVIAANQMDERIRLIKKRSTELTVGPGMDMERRANVLVTELFDTELIGEGAIGTYRHALEHLLTDDVLTIPHRATIYAQVVECPLALNWQCLKTLSNADGDILLRVPPEVTACRGSSAVFDIQLSQFPAHSFNALTEPMPVMEFCWSKLDELKTDRCFKNLCKARTSGFPQAVFMWWDLTMDKEASVALSCAPYWAHPDYEHLKNAQVHPARRLPESNLIPWRDHWMQAVYFLPPVKIPLQKGQEFMLQSYHDEYSLWFSISEETPLTRPHCSCGWHIAQSRSRIGQLNDSLRNKRYLNYFERVFSGDSVVLVLSEGSLLGLAAARMGVKQVLLYEPNAISRRCMEAFVENNNVQNVQFVTSADSLESEQVATVTHVFSEPHFPSAILPWDNLHYGDLLKNLKPLLPASVAVIPASATLYGLPVEFLDLQKINAPLGTCEGFDLSLMDKLIEQHSLYADSPVEAQPLWEYPAYPLAGASRLMDIDFVGDFEKTKLSSGKFCLSEPGRCNGIAIWIEWHLDGSLGPKTTISSGPVVPVEEASDEPVRWNMNWRQGVHLVRSFPNRAAIIPWTVKFNPTLNNVYFQFDYTDK